MPLKRVEVRNEYALGAPELYGEVNTEDPREILDGVAAAGLVGVLRQLGDLADFAADIFHGLREALMTTSSRSRKLVSRVRRIEAALSPLEKAVLAQRTHLHFAYTPGLDWHVPIQCQKNIVVYSDVPQFFKDSYEDCGDPPNFYLLDRFDTGGPGSCLKRYSDPTFFKRASKASGVVKRASKGRRIKKKRSRHRNGELHRDASFLYDNGRVQLTQPNIGGDPSPAQTAPALISELEEQSNMMDSRKRSDYTDGDSCSSYSVQPEELSSRESFSTAVNRHNSNFLDYNIVDGEKIANAYYDIQINPSQDQIACNPSSVTINGKGETLEHTTQESDHYGMAQEEDSDNRPLETFSPNLNLSILGDSAEDFEIVDQSCHQAVRGLESSDVLLDSIKSGNQVAQSPESFDVHLDGFGSCDQAVPTMEPSDVHVDEIGSCNQAVLVMESTNVRLDDIESETDHYMDALNYTIESEGESDVDCMRKESVGHCSKIEDNKRVHHVACEFTSHDLEFRSSITTSFDFANSSPSNASCEESNCVRNGVAVQDEIHSVSSMDNALRSSQMMGESSLNPVNLRSVDSCENDGIISSSPMADEAKSSMESHKNASDTSSTITSVTFWTNGGLLGLQPSKPPDCSMLNGIPQDPVYNNDGKMSLSSYQVENLKNRHRSFSEDRKDLFSGEFPTISPPPSPPLEHMKVSFQPIDGFQTSKLKLKFPDGNTDCGRSSDIFPSFQLVPEAFVTWHYVDSDSDADTFYRSSRSDTDDPHSNRSESESEQWEARQSPTTKDHELYNALGRITLTESVSTVLENGNSKSCQVSDLHSLGSINHASPASEPQWRITTPQPDTMENKSRPMHSYHAYNLIMHSASSISRPKPAPSNEDHIDATNVPKSKSGSWMINGERKGDHGKSIIDENDFLCQIRTKSFNLRPTPTVKPTIVPLGASVNAQVTAILEKVNAIRQAVGSGEEDDGEWSD